MKCVGLGMTYFNPCPGVRDRIRKNFPNVRVVSDFTGCGNLVVDDYDRCSPDERDRLAPLIAEGRCEVFGNMGCIDGDYRIGDVERMRAAEKAIAEGMMPRDTALRELMNI